MELRHSVHVIFRPWMFATVRKSTPVAVMGIKVIVDMPVEMRRAAIPGARAKEHAS